MRLGVSHKRRRNGKVAVIMFLFVAAISIFAFVMYRLQPVFKEYGSAYANNMANSIVNSAVSEVFADNEYSQLTKYKTNSGGMQTIEADTVEINRLKSEISQKIRTKINESKSEVVTVPLGSAFNVYFLSGIGPEIPVRIYPASVVKTDFKDEFVSAGINQVKYNLYLEVTMQMSFVGFAFSENETITSKALIFETVIVGDTPQYYGNGTFAVAQ